MKDFRWESMPCWLDNGLCFMLCIQVSDVVGTMQGMRRRWGCRAEMCLPLMVAADAGEE